MILPTSFEARLKIKKNMDKRTKAYRKQKARKAFWVRLGTSALLGILAGVILGLTLFWEKKTVFKIVKVVEHPAPVQAYEPPAPIDYIRLRAEQLGVPNSDILTLIRIAKCESGMNPEAVNFNTNRTWDAGLFQINKVHKQKLSSMLDYTQNVEYALKLYKAQRFNPWYSSRRCWDK